MSTREIVVSRRRGASLGAFAAGFAAGAAALALLDPRAGARRRGALVQRAIHTRKAVEEFGGKAARDLAHRSRGVMASASARLRRDEPWPDVLVERVRARLGRLTSHASAIEVSVHDGVVELRGPVAPEEARGVVEGVGRVRGVRGVADHLERRGRAPGALAPGDARPGGLPTRSWSPGARSVALAGGAALAAWGMRRGGLARLAGGGAGLWLIARAATNLETARLLGVGADRRAVDLHASATIAAPRPEVFAFFRAFENFPRFMSHVREVRQASDGRWRWKVDGPAGAAVEWEAELCEFVPDQVIAWKTVPGAAVKSAGTVRFQDDERGTRLDVRISYNPVAGALGHALAVLLGADPSRQLHDDLLRLKSLLERGKAGGTTRDELAPGHPGT